MPADRLPVAVAPRSSGWIDAAVTAGGGELVTPERAAALVWTSPDEPDALRALLAEHPGITWVQLPWAGIEPYVHLLDRDHVWSCAKGVYAEPVAEHALALLLAGFRQLGRYARAGTWTGRTGKNLLDARVTILGGGGIAEVLLALLAPFRCTTTVVNRSGRPVAGADRTLPFAQVHDGLRDAEALVLALPLTPETDGLVGEAELALLAPDAWVVNVARGRHVQTDALVRALAEGRIGGAALDVTEPEPLPDDHPLWSLPNAIVTPHTGNTQEMARPLLGARITDNVRRRANGEPLVGLVDLDAGY